MMRPPPRSALFPSTTLCRSKPGEPLVVVRDGAGEMLVVPDRRNPGRHREAVDVEGPADAVDRVDHMGRPDHPARSEEHTSELQSRQYLVCRLLLEKKKTRSI